MADKKKPQKGKPEGEELSMSWDAFKRMTLTSIDEHGRELDSMPVQFKKGEGVEDVYDGRDSAAGALEESGGGMDDEEESDEADADEVRD